MGADGVDWQRSAGQGRYARPERERRFLLSAEPPAGVAYRRIEDRYIDGTRLRLRRVSDGEAAVHKLTQKVRTDVRDPAEVALTTLYLSCDEYDLLCALPCRLVTKTRRICAVGPVRFAVDDFSGRLEGLRLAEVEVDDLQEPLMRPAWLGAEVTHDDRYSGGCLAVADGAEVRRLLAGT